jgi:hypothetical protein
MRSEPFVALQAVHMVRRMPKIGKATEAIVPRPDVRKPGGRNGSTFDNIEWIIANHGSITVGGIGAIGANVGCIAAAADRHLCCAMLAQRDRESPLELMRRLDRAIASAAKTSVTIDEINPPGGFKPRKELKSRPP